MNQETKMDRRDFLKKSAAGALAVGLAGRATTAQEKRPAAEPAAKIREYRPLGRTGFKVSDMSPGFIGNDAVLAAALDAGANYIDSAEQYPGHHKLVAKVMKGRDRKSFFITTKLEILDDVSKEGFLKRARKCLEDLEMDYVDCLMMHMPERAALLKTEGFHTAVEELKAAGRVRHLGISNHGSFWLRNPQETMEKVLMTAVEDGRFDVFLMAYNFLKMDESERVLEACRKKGIGTTIMKSTPVGIYYSIQSMVDRLQQQKKEIDPLYLEGLKNYKEKADRAQAFLKEHNLQDPAEIQQSALRFVLGNPNVSTVCFIARNFEELDRFLSVSGTRLSAAEKARLETYREGCGHLYCRHACGVCEPSCPYGVPVNTIMRYYQYFAAQGREKEAMGYYAAIPGLRADICSGCQGPCEAACPHGVPIQGLLIAAHNQLTPA